MYINTLLTTQVSIQPIHIPSITYNTQINITTQFSSLSLSSSEYGFHVERASDYGDPWLTATRGV